MRIRRFFHIILAAIALVIVWQMVTTWTQAMPDVQPEAARAQKKERAATALPRRAMRTGQRLARQTTDKDLFSPDRKPGRSWSSKPLPPSPFLPLPISRWSASC